MLTAKALRDRLDLIIEREGDIEILIDILGTYFAVTEGFVFDVTGGEYRGRRIYVLSGVYTAEEIREILAERLYRPEGKGYRA